MRQTAADVELDPQTVEDLQPPCDVTWRWIYTGLITYTGPEHRCDQPAAWITYRTCTCGDTRYQLECDPHVKDTTIRWQCPACHRIDSYIEFRTEPLR